jgi:hypothetical protein
VRARVLYFFLSRFLNFFQTIIYLNNLLIISKKSFFQALRVMRDCTVCLCYCMLLYVMGGDLRGDSRGGLGGWGGGGWVGG